MAVDVCVAVGSSVAVAVGVSVAVAVGVWDGVLVTVEVGVAVGGPGVSDGGTGVSDGGWVTSICCVLSIDEQAAINKIMANKNANFIGEGSVVNERTPFFKNNSSLFKSDIAEPTHSLAAGVLLLAGARSQYAFSSLPTFHHIPCLGHYSLRMAQPAQ